MKKTELVLSKIIKFGPIFGYILSIVAGIAYGAWIVHDQFSSFDKRITIVEGSCDDNAKEIIQVKQELNAANETQDKAILRLQESINDGFERAQERIEKIYYMMLSTKGYHENKR